MINEQQVCQNFKFISINSNLSKMKIIKTYRQYSITLEANSYVAPFDATANFIIPDNDIKELGTPVYAGAYGSNGVATPTSFQDKTVSIVGKMTYANATVTVTFAKIVLDN